MKKYSTYLFLTGTGIFLFTVSFSISHANSLRVNEINPTCVDNWEDWPNSLEYDSSHPWSLKFFPATYTNHPWNEPRPTLRQFVDLNGDGKQDYIYMAKDLYATRGNGDYNFTEECVLLGTGHGFETAYRCVMEKRYGNGPPDNPPRYYGDCALIEE